MNYVNMIFETEDITNNIVNNLTNTVFFAGAGISRNSGLPLFQEINRQILKKITRVAPEKLVFLRPEVLLQTLQNELGDDMLSFLEFFRDKKFKPNSNHFLLAHIVKNRGYVITTNWDNLIEQACVQIKAPFKVIHTPKHFEDFVNHKIKLDLDCGYIFKLHGDIEEKDVFSYESIQMTINDVECGLDKNKSTFLDMIKTKKDFCFLGYSGMDDFDIIPYLRKDFTESTFYWIQHNTDIKRILEKNDLIYEDRHNFPDNKQYYQIKNVNDVLHTSKNPYKIQINTDEFVFELKKKIGFMIKKDSDIVSCSPFGNYTNLISDKKNFILGRLYDIANDGNKAIQYFENIINKNDKDKAKACYLLAGIYNKFFGEKEHERILILYDQSFDLYEETLKHCDSKMNESICKKQSEILLSKANYLRRETEYVNEAQSYMEKARKCYPKIDEDAQFNNVFGLLCYKKK